mgnify:FL=1
MNRVIKFRIWDKRNKIFLNSRQGDYEYMVEGLSNGQLSCVRRFLGEYDGIYSEVVIQQFTSLLDKNGKEIYEGDIIGSHVSEKPCNYIVKWGETRSDYCGFVLNPVFINPPKFTYIIHNFKMWMAEGFEVLGNIFENSDILS